MTEHTADLRREEIARTPQLTGAAVAFLLEHRGYPGCTMASLTIRERLEKIEAEARSQDTATARIAALVDAVDALMYKGLEERGPDGRYPAHAGGDRDGHNILIPLRYPDGTPTHLWDNLTRALTEYRAVLSGETRTGGETT